MTSRGQGHVVSGKLDHSKYPGPPPLPLVVNSLHEILSDIWITVNCLYFIYNKRTAEVSDMLEEMKKELFWHLMLERWIAGMTAFNQLYGIIDRMVDDY